MKVIIVICLLFVMSACSNSFLEIYPETSLNESNFYNSDEEFVILVNGCYVPLRDNEKKNHWTMSELKSDNMAIQISHIAGDFTTERMDKLMAGSDNIAYNSFWNNSYKGIYQSNKAISVLEETSYSWANEQLRSRSMGEVYFLRALYYFNLVRQFGGVPIVTKPVTGKEAVEIKRSSVDEVYQLIISDLKTAQQHLSNATQVEEKGRVNEGAAWGILGKVYLTRKDYAEAEQALKKVIDLGKFSLLSDYKDLFDPMAKDFQETIFSIQYSESAAELSNQFVFFNVPYLSKGAVTNRPNIALPIAGSMRPTQDMIDAFEQGDKRMGVSIHYWRGPDWDGIVADIPYTAKYKAPQSSPLDWAGDNFPVLRYADVLLMYAEVLNSQGRTSDAVPYVASVRRRAGLTNDLSGLSQTALDLLIEKERQVEFCFENQRWYDLLRRGRALEVLREHGIDADVNKLLAAIPGEQILINKLEQNPGY